MPDPGDSWSDMAWWHDTRSECQGRVPESIMHWRLRALGDRPTLEKWQRVKAERDIHVTEYHGGLWRTLERGDWPVPFPCVDGCSYCWIGRIIVRIWGFDAAVQF
jgi:hypothetical protein